jgi:hypothetical protein
MIMETCSDGYHFWETDSEICHCGEFKWDVNPLAWPTWAQDEELAQDEENADEKA